jgi:isopenicillin-N N-acyltransferase like protein
MRDGGERMDPFPHVRVSGGARERGRQYGEQARERVRRSIEAYDAVFDHYAGWRWADVRRGAGRFAEPIEAFAPRYLEEIRGIAEGAGVDFEDILGINVRTEVMFAAKARAAAAQADGDGGRPDGCSAFAVLPSASAHGHTLIGQNWDWLLHSFDTVVVLEAAQDEGPDFVTVVEAGLLAKTGMNSSGIGLTTNALITDRDRGEPGVPYHLVLRGILDAENVSDAYATIQRGVRSSSANYLVASVDGIAVDIESAPGDFSRLFLQFPSDGVLLHTNHFVSPAFDATDVSLWVMPDSPFRLERLRTSVRGAGPKLSIEVFESVLADHANYPSGICCHPDARLDPFDRGATVASVLMDLDRRRMWIADGHPCTSPYRELDYGEFLSKPSPVANASPHRERLPA